MGSQGYGNYGYNGGYNGGRNGGYGGGYNGGNNGAYPPGYGYPSSANAGYGAGAGAGASAATKTKKAGKGKKILLSVVAVLIALILAAGLFIYFTMKHFDELLIGGFTEEDQANLGEVLEETNEVIEPFYALLLGIDSYDINATNARADVIILCRVDVPNNTISMVSIPRDTMIKFSWNGVDYGYPKINAAYRYGGAAGMVQAVSEFAGVTISHVGVVSFSGLEDIIDAAGGIDVVVPVSMSQASSMDSSVWIKTVTDPETGELTSQHLTGHEAICFARERKAYPRGDFQRADNQKLVAQAFIRAVLSLPVTGETSMYSVIETLCQIAHTDLTVARLISMATAMDLSELTSYNAMMPGKTYSYNSQSYVITYAADWKTMMQNIDLGRDPYSEEAYDGPDTVNPKTNQVKDASQTSGGMATEW